MQVDWFTVSIQIVNFLILVLLLKRFLYRPIIHAMAQRQKNLVDQQGRADKEMQSAIKLLEQYQEKQGVFESQRRELLDQIKQEVEQQRSIMLDQLREEINQKRHEWHAELVREQASLMQEVRAMMGEKTAIISRHALRDLAGVELESQMLNRFLDQLNQLSKPEKEKLVLALKNKEQITIATRFAMSPKDQQAVEDVLKRLHYKLDLKFEQRSEIICGIILETEGFNWSWCLDSYLDELEESFTQVITPSEIDHSRQDL